MTSLARGWAAWRERGGCDMARVFGVKEETERREQAWLEELCNANPTQRTKKGLFCLSSVCT